MKSRWVFEPEYTEHDFAQVWRGQTGWRYVALCCALGYALGLLFSIFLLLAVSELLTTLRAGWWNQPLVHLLTVPWLVYSWRVAYSTRQERGAKTFNDFRAKFEGIRMEVSEAGLQMSDGKEQHLTAWIDMKTFIEFRDWFLLFRRKDNAVYIIPKRCFQLPSDAAEFSRFVESQILDHA
jgi:hypothetical protein